MVVFFVGCAALLGLTACVAAWRLQVRRIRRRCELYLGTLESTPEALVTFRHNGAVLWANEQATRLFGRTNEQLQQCGLDDLFLREDAQTLKVFFTTGLFSATRCAMPWLDFKGLELDGVPFLLRVQIRMHTSPTRNHLTFALRDARMETNPEDSLRRYADQLKHVKQVLHSQNRNVQLAVSQRTEKLEQAKQAAEKASRFKSDFLAEVSHEMKNPLQGILSFAELGVQRCEETPPEKLKSFFEAIERCGQTMLTLIERLLMLARIEAGVLNCDCETCDLVSLAESVAAEFVGRCCQENIQLNLDITERPVAVDADEGKLCQVIRNLVSNAVRFSPPGGTVQISVRQEGKTARLAVHDEGPGIQEDELQRVFERFFQASTNDDKGKGTGLGLTICKQIVELHDGEIHVENAVEGGAIFSFSLPTSAVSVEPATPSTARTAIDRGAALCRA